jgi:hypothetical protein
LHVLIVHVYVKTCSSDGLKATNHCPLSPGSFAAMAPCSLGADIDMNDPIAIAPNATDARRCSGYSNNRLVRHAWNTNISGHASAVIRAGFAAVTVTRGEDGLSPGLLLDMGDYP